MHPLPAPTVVKLNENSNIGDGFWEKKHWPANLQVLLLKLYRLPRFIVDTRQQKIHVMIFGAMATQKSNVDYIYDSRVVPTVPYSPRS